MAHCWPLLVARGQIKYEQSLEAAGGGGKRNVAITPFVCTFFFNKYGVKRLVQVRTTHAPRTLFTVLGLTLPEWHGGVPSPSRSSFKS